MDGPGDAQVWVDGQVYDIHVKVSEQLQAYEHLEPYPKPCSEAEVNFARRFLRGEQEDPYLKAGAKYTRLPYLIGWFSRLL